MSQLWGVPWTQPWWSVAMATPLQFTSVHDCQIPTFNSAQSWQHYSAAQLGDQAASTKTWYPSQSYYPGTEPTSLCPILIMLSAWLGNNKSQFLGHFVWPCLFGLFDNPINYQNGRWTLNSFGHPVCVFWCQVCDMWYMMLLPYATWCMMLDAWYLEHEELYTIYKLYDLNQSGWLNE